jgi:transcriptional regulator with XRE-family HTH domain
VNHDLYSAAGARIRSQRESLSLTREQLSERAGISVQFIADIERGRKGFTVDTLKKLCDALRMSADYVVSGDGRLPETAELSQLLESIALTAEMIERFRLGLENDRVI